MKVIYFQAHVYLLLNILLVDPFHQQAAYYTFPLHDDIGHINNSLQAFTSVPEVISKQRLWTHTVNFTEADVSHFSDATRSHLAEHEVKGPIASATNCCGEKKSAAQKQVGEYIKE